MNKLLKGSIAGAAGIVLLLGGAGTLAAWNSTAQAGSSATITAGTLNIAASTTATADGWSDAAGDPITIANYRIVPGDTVTFTKTFDITAIGDNLEAEVALGADSITAATTAGADVALAGLLTSTASFEVDGVSTSTVVASAGTQEVVVSVDITFPDGTTAADNPAKNGVVSFADFAITLTQTV